MDMCEDKLEFENQRHKSSILAVPHLVLTEQNLSLTKKRDMGHT